MPTQCAESDFEPHGLRLFNEVKQTLKWQSSAATVSTLFNESPLLSSETTKVYECAHCSVTYEGGIDQIRKLPHGYGVFNTTLPFSDTAFEHRGEFTLGKPTGHGIATLYCSNSQRVEVEGDWNSFQHMTITLGDILIYEGPFNDFLPHGHGVQHLQSGLRYIGMFNHGEREGEGELLDEIGRSIYRGTWRGDVPDGMGQCNLIDGSGNPHFWGSFANGTAEPYGRLADHAGGSSRTLYEGQFRDGLPHGRGLFFYPEGAYEGTFEQGKRSGHGVFTFHDGRIYTGRWKDDLPHGPGDFDLPYFMELIREESAKKKKKGKDCSLPFSETSIRAVRIGVRKSLADFDKIQSHLNTSYGIWKAHLNEHCANPGTLASVNTLTIKALEGLGILAARKGEHSKYRCIVEILNSDQRITTQVANNCGNCVYWNEVLALPRFELPAILHFKIEDDRNIVLGASIYEVACQDDLGAKRLPLIGPEPTSGMKVHIGRLLFKIV